MSELPPLQLSCPESEDFVACNYGTRFLGCCADRGADVCTDGCSPGFLDAAEFNQLDYSILTPNDCDTTSKAGEWYTCESTSPPFLGCCASNACSSGSGCFNSDLLPAKLSTNDTNIAPFASYLIQQPAAATTPIPAIIGGTVGGVFFLIVVSSIVWYRVRKIRKSSVELAKVETDEKDLEVIEPPISFPVSPSTEHDAPKDLGAGSTSHELHTESAPLAEIASSDAPVPVPELPVLNPASTPQKHLTGFNSSVSGSSAYSASGSQSLRGPQATLGGPFDDNLVTNI